VAILSVQSQVAYGYVGNKAAAYPLQNMGYDVWTVNTVQFSNHTGYDNWRGQEFSSEHIRDIFAGIEELGVYPKCRAVLSGYVGSRTIHAEICKTVMRVKKQNPNAIYLCDPVIGDIPRGIFVKPDIITQFLEAMSRPEYEIDIITPNHFEAETLSKIQIQKLEDAKEVAAFFHKLGIKIVLITSLRLKKDSQEKLHIFLSTNNQSLILSTEYYPFSFTLHGTGDLFSALFLGLYLKSRNPIEALKQTVVMMDKVVKKTFVAKSKELLVTSINYADIES